MLGNVNSHYQRYPADTKLLQMFLLRSYHCTNWPPCLEESVYFLNVNPKLTMYVRNLIRLHIYQVTLYKQKENFFSKTFRLLNMWLIYRRHLIESYIKVLPLELKRHKCTFVFQFFRGNHCETSMGTVTCREPSNVSSHTRRRSYTLGERNEASLSASLS